MSKVKFFSNSLIVIGGKECEITTSLAGTRLQPQSIFEVPEHTIGTKNLLIYVDGKLLMPYRDYTDVNSHQVELTTSIDIDSDFYAILIITGNDGTAIGGVEWEDF